VLPSPAAAFAEAIVIETALHRIWSLEAHDRRFPRRDTRQLEDRLRELRQILPAKAMGTRRPKQGAVWCR
jgi:hypothetical protein